MDRNESTCRIRPIDGAGGRIELIQRKAKLASIPTEVMQNCLLAVSDRRSILKVNGRLFESHPGDIVFIRPGQAIAVETLEIPQTGTTYRGFELSPESMQRLSGRLEFLRGRFPVLKSPVAHDPDLSPFFADLHQELIAANDPEARDRAVEVLLRRLSEHSLAEPMSPGERPTTVPKVRRALQFMHEHFAEELEIARLAEVAGLSVSRLAHLFTERVGLSPHSYLTQYRVHRAKGLLCGGVSPGRVAVECGFYDQPHFTRHFKHLTGLTPGQYAAGSCKTD